MKRRRNDGVVVAYVGDGAIANGEVHETLNMASLWQLPLLIVRTDNAYAESTSAGTYSGIPDVLRFVEGYGVVATAVDGNDVVAVAQAARQVVGRVREEQVPAFLQCRTYRKYGHNTADPGAYRPPEEVEAWRQRDPLIRARSVASELGVTDADLDAVDGRITDRIERAIAAAEEQPAPPLAWADEDVYGDPATEAAFGGVIQ